MLFTVALFVLFLMDASQIVAEAYSKACEDTMTLDFELKDLSHSLKELKKLSNPCSLTKPLQTHIETDIIHTSTTSKAPNTTTKPRKLAVDATVTSKTRGPRYLMDCLSDLKTGEGADPERLELALVAAPSLILTATDLLLGTVLCV